MLILLKSFFPNILFAGERKKPEASDAASDHSYDLVDGELESAGIDEKQETSAVCERVEESAVCERVEESAVCEKVEESAVCERVEESECEGVKESAVCERVKESAVCERVKESAAVDISKESVAVNILEKSDACAGEIPEKSKCKEEGKSAEDILKKKNSVVDGQQDGQRDGQRDDHNRALLMVKTLSRLQLVEMCKRHNLMRTGGKFQLAHRIVLFNKNV